MSVTSTLNRRATELLLLLAAAPVVILLFCLTIINDGIALDAQTLAVPLGLVAAFLIAHLAMRYLAPNADGVLLPLAFILSGIGIAFVMRLAPELAGRQVIWLFIGVAAMILTLILVRSVQKLADFKYTIMLAGIILMLLPIFVGAEINGSKIWLKIFGFSFQPGELAKICVVLFLAAYLADNRDMLSVSARHLGPLQIPDFRTLLPMVVMWALSMLIVVFEKDLGSALLFFGLFVTMIFVATGRISYVIISLLLAIVGAIAAFIIFDHVQLRVSIWQDPFADPSNSGLQLVQALYSLADGDLIGTGIGRGMPEFIPIVESDFIFVAMAEEMGLLGASGILIAFVLFAVRGFAIASRAKSDSESIAAAGLTTAISLQAFVIVGGVTLLIPLTGLTLPFMSQGGSSLLASFIIVGLLLRISDKSPATNKALEATAAFESAGLGAAASDGVLSRFALGKRLTVLITIFSVLFAILIANLSYQMIIRAPELRALPINNHAIAREQMAERGAIISANDIVLAKSVQQSDGSYTRDYPEGQLAAHVIGYASARYGMSGVEAIQQETLRGDVGFSSWTDAINSIAGVPTSGNDVQLTLDTRIQAEAERLLNGHFGAAIVLDASTGAILAEASTPTYDINNVQELLLASTGTNMASTGANSQGEADTTASNSSSNSSNSAGTESLNGSNSNFSANSSALYNRATAALYPPGSTFKLVTLTSALTKGGISLNDTFSAAGEIQIGNAPITNYHGTDYGDVTVKRALELSANTVFAQIADRLGATNLVQTANDFGFGQKLGLDFSSTPSLMPDPKDMTAWETAWAGAGEPVGEHASSSPAGPQATVLQMACVTSAFANNGTIMNPYIVDRVLSPDGTLISKTTPKPFASVASADVVSKVNECMAGTVANGTGYAAQIPGYTVYGKTGTAETGAASDDSWFVGYVNVNGRNIVVAMVVEKAGEGFTTPLAKELLLKAIEVL
ncbi:MAG: FtsW/RodA/SpoVE family cell cycle protein [Coriobacteriales bacterium]|jgi:peptidoglycan glycosyltransferase|nr:FtsW/RodA/SpoVE family cell cycle protein [Coriobacteriales bacterium]